MTNYAYSITLPNSNATVEITADELADIDREHLVSDFQGADDLPDGTEFASVGDGRTVYRTDDAK